jgi:hypothetical protein
MHVSFSYRFHRFLLSTNSNYHQMVNNAQWSFSDIRQLWWIHTILYRGLIQVFPQ